MRKKTKKQEANAGDEEVSQEFTQDSQELADDKVAENDSDSKQKDPETEMAELRDRLQRTTAEFMNFRKQNEKRQRDSRLFVRRDVFEQLLPIVDNFGAAMKALEQGQDAKNVLIGVKMIHEMLEKLLQDNGIKTIEALSQPFDPSLHEAVSREEKEDTDANIVINEIAKGYKMGDLVLRHARVVVSAAPEESEVTTTEEEDEDQKS